MPGFIDALSGSKKSSVFAFEVTALLDVDLTSLYEEEEGAGFKTVYNDKLLEALKEKGIKKVYLFTDMIFKTEDMENRKKLISFLEENGYEVLGVITTCDYVWHASDESLKAFQENYDKQTIRISDRNLKNREETRLACKGLIEKFLADNPQAIEKACAGDAFRAARKSGGDGLRIRSERCKQVADCISFIEELASSKALMFKLYRKAHPESCSIVYCDDSDKHLNAVAKINNNEVILTTIKVPTHYSENSKDFFIGEIEGHLQKVKNEINNQKQKMLQMIRGEIFKLKDAKNNEKEILALQALYADIFNESFNNKSLLNVINDWEVNQAIMNDKKQSDEAKTAEKIIGSWHNFFSLGRKYNECSPLQDFLEVLKKLDFRQMGEEKQISSPKPDRRKFC